MTITGDFERFQYYNFETSNVKKRKPFLKNWSTIYLVEIASVGYVTFPYKMTSSKAMLR